jgi:hypothetical protein
MCRASTGECDVAETCTGVSETCPADAFAPASLGCTGTSQDGDCDDDAADHCTGTDSSCVDAFRSSATECRASAGECDAPESCTGTSANCPDDSLAAAGTACTDDGNPCTDDVCAGSGNCVHPVNGGPPAGGSTLRVQRDGISWTAQGDASLGYDVVRGNLAVLSSSAGGFTLAIEECVADDYLETSTASPRRGEPWFFLVRGVSCGGNGSFGSGSAALVETRDEQIAESPDACP